MSFGQLMLDMWMVLWVCLPLIGANMLAVVTGRGGHPIDRGGRLWLDGERVLGDGKTYEGFFFAPFFAMCFTVSLAVILPQFLHPERLSDLWVDERIAGWILMLALGFGALTGDLIKSFCKRRGRNPRGAAWPFWDQFDAVAGGFFFSWLVCHLAGSDWFTRNLIPGRWLAVVLWLPLYWILHRGFSIAAHRLGWKKTPA